MPSAASEGPHNYVCGLTVFFVLRRRYRCEVSVGVANQDLTFVEEYNYKGSSLSMRRSSDYRGLVMKLFSKCVLVIALVVAMFSVGHADTIYTESVNGELSNDGLIPTTITVGAGSNFISGTTGAGPNFRDYFTISVTSGLRFVSLIELGGTQAGNLGFLGLQSGPQVTLPTNTPNAAGLLGWVHYAPTSSDIDVLPAMAIPANGSSGFTLPLGPGNYSFWLQDSSPGTFDYSFNIVLAPVPEVSTAALTIVGVLALVPILRRRLQS